MKASNPLLRLHFRPDLRLPSRSLGRLVALGLALASSASAQTARPDQVLWTNNRGQVVTVTGTLTENGLEKVVVEGDGSPKDLPADRVVRVTFGDVPASFHDGVAYLERKDFENAAAKFALAASDTDARDVVRAAARLQAARAWMLAGAADPSGFSKALEELGRFEKEAPRNRDLPAARLLEARATWLTGKPAEAAELYRALYKELAAGTVGYPADLCLEAGTLAASAYLAAKDTLKARELDAELEGILPGQLSQAPEGDPRRVALAGLLANVRLGEGFALLAGGDLAKARSFFQSQLSGADNPAHRWGATLGLAETLQREGALREAQIEFAKVSAIDHTDRDRTARALVGLAECALALDHAKAKENARTWLQTVLTAYGDTTSVLAASELASRL